MNRIYLDDIRTPLEEKRKKMSRLEKKSYPIKFPYITVHSHNPIGSANMSGYINNFLKNEGQEEDCERAKIPYRD